MVMVKDLTEITLKEKWQEVKDEEGRWGDIDERALNMVKLIEDSLESELLEMLRADRYQRTEVRRGYRNGHYEKSLFTRFGVMEAVRIPRARESHESKILHRYHRRQDEVNNLIRDMFLAGVSTRRVGEVLEVVNGEKVSAQTVSRITRSLDSEVHIFQNRPLADGYL